jgi:uncharacterized protein YjlB
VASFSLKAAENRNKTDMFAHQDEIVEPRAIHLSPNQWVPNNADLPVLLYRNAVDDDGDTAADFEALFERNGWPPAWRNGIHDYHHFHVGAHEALGIAAGSAVLVLGGPDGQKISVDAGDLLVLPAGTGHCRIKASPNLLVVGAYPEGQTLDTCREATDDRGLARIAAVPLPERDPLSGSHGPLARLWQRRNHS